MPKKSAKMQEIEKKPKYDKDALVREISQKADFNLGDSKLFVDTLIEILEDSVVKQRHFAVGGLFKLIYGGLPKRESTNPHTGERVILAPSTRLTVRLAKNIKNLVR